MNVAKQILISGRVQGVFFRQGTFNVATALQLTGGVRNLGDGRVEVRVAGPDESVQTLIKWLEIGPKDAKVTTIEIVDCPDSPEQNPLVGRFEIWPTK